MSTAGISHSESRLFPRRLGRSACAERLPRLLLSLPGAARSASARRMRRGRAGAFPRGTSGRSGTCAGRPTGSQRRRRSATACGSRALRQAALVVRGPLPLEIRGSKPRTHRCGRRRRIRDGAAVVEPEAADGRGQARGRHPIGRQIAMRRRRGSLGT
jgi:hypothetical protein